MPVAASNKRKASTDTKHVSTVALVSLVPHPSDGRSEPAFASSIVHTTSTLLSTEGLPHADRSSCASSTLRWHVATRDTRLSDVNKLFLPGLTLSCAPRPQPVFLRSAPQLQMVLAQSGLGNKHIEHLIPCAHTHAPLRRGLHLPHAAPETALHDLRVPHSKTFAISCLTCGEGNPCIICALIRPDRLWWNCRSHCDHLLLYLWCV